MPARDNLHDHLFEALVDFRDRGLRCDLTPTRPIAAGVSSDEYVWWADYLRRADEQVRLRATNALAAYEREVEDSVHIVDDLTTTATSIANVINRHVEIWDDDCHEHGGCSCGWMSSHLREPRLYASESLPEGVDDHAMFPSRVEWRNHLAEVITNR